MSMELMRLLVFSRQEKYLNNATLWEAAAEGDVKGESPRGNAFSAANTAP